MNKMLATVLNRFGGPAVLECHTVERPVRRADMMLVRVAACGVCGHDPLDRQGHFPETKPPCVMGMKSPVPLRQWVNWSAALPRAIADAAHLLRGVPGVLGRSG